MAAENGRAKERRFVIELRLAVAPDSHLSPASRPVRLGGTEGEKASRPIVEASDFGTGESESRETITGYSFLRMISKLLSQSLNALGNSTKANRWFGNRLEHSVSNWLCQLAIVSRVMSSIT